MKKHLLRVLATLLFPFLCIAQPGCPDVIINPSSVSICSGCTTLTATIQGTVTTTSYSVSQIPYAPQPFNVGNPILIGIDDQWSGVVNLPFCFEFYGNTYTQCIVGANGAISFDISNANSFNTWPINAAIPSNTPTDMLNSIMAPWQDIDPTYMGDIYWNLTGIAPCRQLVVSWDSIPYFGDPNSVSTGSCNTALWASQQIVLYETTNIIEINIRNKDLCTGWNSGYAIEGIQNATGTQAVTVPGRNFPSLWTATNDSWRFTPTGTPQYTLTWFDGPTSLGNSLSINVCPTVTTTYTAQLVNNTCNGPVTVTDQTTVTISPAFTLSTSFTPASCGASDGTATVNITSGGAPPFNYLWSSAPPQATSTATSLPSGNYTVTVTDNNGCSATATVNVTMTSAVTAVAVVTGNNPVCPGQSTTLTVNVNGGSAPFNYLWSPAADLNSSTLQTVTATPTSGTTYTVTVTDANGCTTSANCTVTIAIPPVVTVSPDITICPGASTTLTAAGADTYVWSPAAGLSSTTGNPVTATPPSTTMYQVIGTDATTGCTDTAFVTITHGGGPTADFFITNPVQIFTSPVIFTDNSTGAATYFWTFGDGGTDIVPNPVHQYTVPAVWPVCLMIADAGGCVDTVCKDVTLFGFPADIYFPNAFTPNDNHHNDIYLPLGISISIFTMDIYDRWGEKIFSTNDINKGWDGTYQGKPVPNAIYVYKAHVEFENFDIKEFYGSIALIR
jgi:gliding motility-associated-like protein